MPRRFNWKVFLILWLGSIVGVIALLPYVLTLQGALLANLPLPLEVLLPLQIAQNAILFAIAIALGMFFAYRCGLGAPLLEALTRHEPPPLRLKDFVVPAVALGIISTLLVVALSFFVFQPALIAELGARADVLTSRQATPPAWQGFLASFYGGIDEEVLTRLLLLSFFAFVGKFISHTTDGRPTLGVLWVANLLSALLFGAGHLPTASLLVPLTPLVVTSVVVSNAIVGLAAGYLYFTFGLEAAMLAHFTADLILHVLFAL